MRDTISACGFPFSFFLFVPSRCIRVRHSSPFSIFYHNSFCSKSALAPDQAHPQGNNRVERTIACIAPEIFIRDVCMRVTKPNLPTSDVRINSTPQLVYCLTLLNNNSSSLDGVATMDETLEETESNWL